MSLGLGVHNEPAEVPRTCTVVASLGVSVAPGQIQAGLTVAGYGLPHSGPQVRGMAWPSEGCVCLDWSSAASHWCCF